MQCNALDSCYLETRQILILSKFLIQQGYIIAISNIFQDTNNLFVKFCDARGYIETHTQSSYPCPYLKCWRIERRSLYCCAFNFSNVHFEILLWFVFQAYSPSEYLLRGKVTILDRKTCTETYGTELTPRLMCTFDKEDGPCVVSAADTFSKVLCRWNVLTV